MHCSRFSASFSFPPWPSEPQVTWCCITSTDTLRFPSCGMEYPFHFGNVVPLICSFFISNHQIAFSPRRLASACLKDTILVYTGSIKTPLLSQIWPTFPSLITRSIWEVVCTELGRLTGWCSWGVGGISCLLCYHTMLSLASISPLRQRGWIGLMRGVSGREERDGSEDWYGQGQRGRKKL